MRFKRLGILIAILIEACGISVGQILIPEKDVYEVLDADSLREAFDRRPYFGLYKDNYFIFGTAVGSTPTVRNTNVKFQISISQRLTKSVLPWGTYLYLFYSQKCFWNVLEESMPMTDLNFNPGIGLGKPLFVKDRFIGEMKLMLEHESNGKDGDDSRSWNKLSFAANIAVAPGMIIHGKAWLPIVDGQNNKDILDYCGIYQMGMSLRTYDKKWGLSIILTKRKGWTLNYNSIAELCYRFNNNQNQYLFLQYYNGYGEGLLEYNKFHSQLRAGIVIKPELFSDF
ncbi:MAG: phospholipase [Bacteroidales bacterium]|nr:phospholipase [Bacteroidales bacterium]